jgi:hypothetical protein
VNATNDVILSIYYRVPTRVETSAYQVTSLWQKILSFLGLMQNEVYATVYIDGRLIDYYGNGVPSRIVTVKIYSSSGSPIAFYNLSTDVSGYFRTPDIMLIRNATYRVEIDYQGDDVYVGTSKSFEFNVAALPVAPAPATPVTLVNIAVIAITVIIIVAAIVIGIKIARKAVAEAIENEMSFVKRKRFVTKK